MKYYPRHDIVLVEKVRVKKTTLIELPDNSTEKTQLWRVVKKGPGTVTDRNELIPIEFQEGDTVILDPRVDSIAKMPGEKNLYLVTEAMVAIRVADVDLEPETEGPRLAVPQPVLLS